MPHVGELICSPPPAASPPCSLAHVELNAIDLAWDTVVRFSRYGLPPAFYADFARCAGRACWLLVACSASRQGTYWAGCSCG